MCLSRVLRCRRQTGSRTGVSHRPAWNHAHPNGRDQPMNTYGHIVVVRIAALALGIMACQAAGFEQMARGAAAAQQAPIAPHPSTQSPEKLVTHEQMLEWEQEMKNWGRWGLDDHRGTLNLITPEKTQAAVRLVREGTSVSLYHFPDPAIFLSLDSIRRT